MKTQFDGKQRVVALTNLEAMCEHVSGVCHRFQVVKVTANRVHVEYSNPDEWANDHPMVAIFPCYPCDDRDKEQRAVVLEFLRIIHDSWNGEGWQAFMALTDCPTLWRDPVDGKWKTESEIRQNYGRVCGRVTNAPTLSQ